MGPITYFDKSFLGALSVDEAAVFSFLYKCHLTPLLLAECLVDLSKKMRAGRSANDVVGGLAHRTAAMGRNLNVDHMTLCAGDLLGHRVEMRGVPVLGNIVRGRGGERVIDVANPTREALAMERWERAEFEELERDFAKDWRASIEGLDLKAISRTVREVLQDNRPKSLEQALSMARSICDGRGNNFASIRLARSLFLADGQFDQPLMTRWQAAGRPPLSRFAPYASHCAVIDIFFSLALANGLISDERPSNQIDVAYFYYLPFCMVFISGDKLHRRVAPLFMTDEQVFAWGPEVKSDLKAIENHYASLPIEERERGLFQLVRSPPPEVDGITRRLWEMSLKRPTPVGGSFPKSMHEMPQIRRLSSEIAEAIQNAKAPSTHGSSEADAVVLRYRFPARMGRWELFPPDVRKKQNRDGTVDVRSSETKS